MKFFRDALLAALAMCATFAILEGLLRIAHVRLTASLFDSDNERGYVLRPNAEGWSTVENEVYLKINSDGMRDVERPLERPPHTLRVAVIGSSEVEASQVPFDETFEAVMTRELSRHLAERGWKAEVLNFGADGYAPSQVYLTLKNHVWKYSPQVVIFLFSAWTVQETVRDFYPENLKFTPVWLLQDGKLVPDHISRYYLHYDDQDVRRRGQLADLMNRFYLLSLLHAAGSKAVHLPEEWQAMLEKTPTARAKSDSKTSAVTSDFLRSYNPDRPEMKEAWQITDAFFKIMAENCDEHGAEFWIVASDQAVQVDPSLAVRKDFQQRMGINSLDASDERVQQLGAAHGIPVFATAHILGDYAASHGVYVHSSASPTERSHHWNKLGNELAGKAISEELLAHSAAVQSIKAASGK